MKNNKIKVVTYLRVASNNDKELVNKENEMMKLIDKHENDWVVVAQYEDIGCSGRKFDREGLSNLFEKLDDVDMVVTLSPQMIARDVLVYKDIYQKIESKKCTLYIRDVHHENVPKRAVKLDLFPKSNAVFA